MPKAQLPIVKGDAVENADYRDALPVNLYTVVKKIKGADGYLLNHPGLREHALGTGNDRGGIFSERFNEHYRVSGNSLIEISGGGAVNNLTGEKPAEGEDPFGYVPISGNSDVQFAQSFNNLGIVANGDVYYYSPDKGLRQINVNIPTEHVPPQKGNPNTNLFKGEATIKADRKASGIGTSIFNGEYVNTGIYGYVDGDRNNRWVNFESSENTHAPNNRFPLYHKEGAVDEDTGIKAEDCLMIAYWKGSSFSWRFVSNENIPLPRFRIEDAFDLGVFRNVESYTPTLPFAAVDGPQNADLFGNTIDIAFINGVFLMTDGENLYHTKISDEERIDPLAFASAEFLPDEIIGVEKTQDNLIVAFGRYSIEYFVPNPANAFAFQRSQGLALKTGLVGTSAKAELDGTYFILGGRREESISIHAVGSGQTKSIASREIDKILAEYTEIELQGAVFESRVEDGDKFIYVHLPRHTLLYNHTVASQTGVDNAWSILRTSIVSDGTWTGIHTIFDPRISKWIFGSRDDSKIGILDNTISTLYGENVEWLAYTPFAVLDGMSIDEIEIKTISGFTDLESKVFVSLTYNGETYGKEYSTSYGKKNQRGKRFILRRLGYVRDEVGFKLRGVGDGRVALGTLDITYG